MINILIADDHEFVRAGLRAILEQAGDIRIGAEASDAHQVVDHLRAGQFDLVVLDMSMPGPSGLALIKRIHDEWPKTKMLVLTMHSEPQYAVRALRAGAKGFLEKTSASSELIAAVQKIVAGGAYASMDVLGALIDAERQPNGLPHTSLSDREYQVFQCLVAGKSANEIATTLNISVKTASAHKANILQKMQLHSIAELTHYAIKHGLSPSSDLLPE